jgi:glycerate kinase
MRIACDVDNPLLGTFGATQVFGPQKGFSSQDLQRAEQGLDRVARLFVKSMGCDPAHFEELGAGAAGGLGFGLRTAAGASFVPGFSLVAAWLGLEEQIADADLVITGEGRFDCSSLRGKGPGTIAKMAAEAGKRVLVLAGSLEREAVEELNALHPSVRTREISCPDLSLAENLRQAPPRLVKVLQEWIETENWNLS